MSYVWTPLFAVFGIIEFWYGSTICGSSLPTGQMWFMWLVMSLMMCKPYVKGITK